MPPAVDATSVADGAVIGASIDIGANSVHLLVAAVAGHRVEPLLDESVFLGLGDRVARDGKLGPEARRDVINALASYAATASRLGARDLTIVGTEPIRRAFDRPRSSARPRPARTSRSTSWITTRRRC